MGSERWAWARSITLATCEYLVCMYMCLSMFIIMYESGQAHYHSCINDLHTELSDVYRTMPCALSTPSMYYKWRLTSASLGSYKLSQAAAGEGGCSSLRAFSSATRYFHCSDLAIRGSHVTTNDYPHSGGTWRWQFRFLCMYNVWET